MRKTAIIFVGEVSTLNQTYINIQKNLIETNNADVFAVINDSKQDISFLKPKRVIYSSQIKYDFIREREIKLKNKPAYTNLFSHQQYFRNSNHLTEIYQFSIGLDQVLDYEKVSGYKYDFIIKSRLDAVFTNPFRIEDLYIMLDSLSLKDSGFTLPKIPGDLSCDVFGCGLDRYKMIDKIESCVLDTNPIFKWLYDNDKIQQVEGVIFSIKNNCFFGGKRCDMIKLGNLWNCIGDYYYPSIPYFFYPEKQFHMYLEENNIYHLDFWRDKESKYLYSKELNLNILNGGVVVDCEFSLLRTNGYLMFYN
jgi:hypothetical protein